MRLSRVQKREKEDEENIDDRAPVVVPRLLPGPVESASGDNAAFSPQGPLDVAGYGAVVVPSCAPSSGGTGFPNELPARRGLAGDGERRHILTQTDPLPNVQPLWAALAEEELFADDLVTYSQRQRRRALERVLWEDRR